MIQIEVTALGKIWEAEINNKLPYQSKAKVYKKLEGEGLCEETTTRMGEGVFTAHVRGWILTSQGRQVYCNHC